MQQNGGTLKHLPVSERRGDTRGHPVCDSIYVARPGQAQPQTGRVRGWEEGWRGRGWAGAALGDRVSFGDDENVLETEVMFTRP